MAGLVVARDGGIGSDDFFLGAIWLWAVGCDGDVLTDWEAEDRVGRREFEFIAAFVSTLPRALDLVAYIATLCEILSFSMSSNSWNWSGLRTFCSPAHPVSYDTMKTREWGLRDVPCTYACSRPSILRVLQPEQWHKEANLSSQSRRQLRPGRQECRRHLGIPLRDICSKKTSCAYSSQNC